MYLEDLQGCRMKRETAVQAARLLQDLDEVQIAKIRLSGIQKKENTPEAFQAALDLAAWALGRLELRISNEVDRL